MRQRSPGQQFNDGFDIGRVTTVVTTNINDEARARHDLEQASELCDDRREVSRDKIWEREVTDGACRFCVQDGGAKELLEGLAHWNILADGGTKGKTELLWMTGSGRTSEKLMKSVMGGVESRV